MRRISVFRPPFVRIRRCLSVTKLPLRSLFGASSSNKTRRGIRKWPKSDKLLGLRQQSRDLLRQVQFEELV